MLLVRSIEMGISNIFCHYSMPILLSSGALVYSVNDNAAVPERVKTLTVVLHLN